MVYYNILFFTFGAIWGSFLNVLIYRLPRNKNVVFPRSQCPSCECGIKWYENVPIISFIFLRGRCSNCQKKIPLQYPIVELLAGLMALWLGPTVISLNSISIFLFFFSVFCVFLVHFFIDLEHKILLNSLNIYLAIVFLSFSIIFRPWTFWLSGALLGAGLPLLVTWLFYLLRGQVGLGGGDIKLYGALGLFLGPEKIIYTISASCLLGSVVGLTLVASKKMNINKAIPFGPFILIVATIQIFFPNLVNFLLKVF